MADAQTAELIEIKDLAWLARDGVGLERTALVDAINAGSLLPPIQKRASDLRARAEVTWTMVRELSARPGLPAEVVDAVKTAHVETFKNMRSCGNGYTSRSRPGNHRPSRASN